jgi:trigger factor
MSKITKENIGLQHEKLTLTLEKTDYLPAFEKTLKSYSKNANIPGFRKGMVPSGLIKKMYGPSLFTDEVMRTVDRELIKYLETEKLDIFAQPLPLDLNLHQLDVNSPADYTFQFEIGLKPEFPLPALSKAPITNYQVTVTEEMIQNEISRLQNRYGNMKDEASVHTEDNVLNVHFTETDATGKDIENGVSKENSLLVKYFTPATRKELMGKKKDEFITIQLKTAFDDPSTGSGDPSKRSGEREWIIGDLGLKDDPNAAERYFRVTITKIGLLEKRELNEEFFHQLYPNQDIKTEFEFRDRIKEEIEGYWKNQSRSQVHDQVFHFLTDHVQMQFPETFLRHWLKTQQTGEGQEEKSDEQVEKEFPVFINQLKWTLVSDKIVQQNNIDVKPEEIRAFISQQLFSYMGTASPELDQPWVKDYVEKMMKDRKYVEDAYHRIQSQKIFQWTETQVKPIDKPISAEAFSKMAEEHQHHHH